MSGPLILLVGMMGAGKTTVGRAIAQRTGWVYLDNDELVEQATGSTPPHLLATGGEGALRAAETQALRRAVALPPPAVAGVAGGVVLDPGNREMLRAVPGVVWLRARPQTLIHRVGTGAGRAWLQPDPAAVIGALASAREPYYSHVARIVVDVDDRTADEVAAAVLSALD
ncbi:MAG: shikimate kinase [Mycobacteriales bacterium]